MSTKSILKKTTVADASVYDKVDNTNIILDDDIVSIEQDGGAKDSKKTQIKKKESIGASASASDSKPPLKITKKKVSITEQPEEPIIKDDKSLAKEKVKEVEKGVIKREDKKEDKEEDKNREVLVDIGKALKASKKPSKKQDITEIFNDDDVDYRYIITNYDFSKNKTLPRITKYEKALLVGKRAKQIEEGANPNVKVLPGQTSIDIAEEELRQRKIPFIIKRPIGNKFEYWKPIDMEVIMD
jgi:DNA-directed RNA polymerase subunit K/omega